MRFQKMQWVLGLALLASGAQAGECDALFERRGESPAQALQAGQCFLALPTADLVDLTFAARGMSFSYLRAKTRPERELAIAEGLKVATRMESLGYAAAFYWKAVFISFDANLKDEGAVLPRQILARLPELKENLRLALEKDPMTHYAGPSRILGILYLSLPGVLGGDVPKGAALIEDAYREFPNLTQNILWRAKALLKQRRSAEGKALLSRLANLSDAELDPLTFPESQDDRQEARTILSRLE